mmetsp:Transcript_5121/g.19165  ORF Transcript_5121/g.19165 Transcript_5121/m.19165 type:complete len:89 (-) Transcript_5121:496-762(-)
MARRTGFELCLNAGRGLFAGARLGGASSSSAGWMTCPAMYTQTRGAKKSTRRVEVMLTQYPCKTHLARTHTPKYRTSQTWAGTGRCSK